jgi:hypothetical protein
MIRVWAVVVAWRCLVTAAHADVRSEQADQLFAEGRALLVKQNDPKAACEKFEQAIKLEARATGTMLNLGLCYEMLGKHATSIRWFRKAQSAAFEAGQSDVEAAAKQHISVLSPKLATIKLTFDAAPAGAQIWVDGTQIDPTSYGGVELDPGSHEIVVRAPSHHPRTESITVVESERRGLVLRAGDIVTPVYVDRGKPRRRAALIVGASGGVALGFTLGYGLYMRSKYKDPDTNDPDAVRTQLRYIGTSTFIVGIGLVGAATYLYLTAPGKERVPDASAIAPLVGADRLGVAFLGRF